MAESIESAPAWQRGGLYGNTGPQRLAPLDDDLVADGESLVDDDARSAGAGSLDPADRRLAAVDHEDIDALLVRDQRRLRNDDFFLRRPAFKRNAYQLAV